MAYITADLAQARNASLLDYSDTLVDEAIAEFASIAERYLGVAYETRTATEQITVRPLTSTVQLRQRNLITLTSITVDGATLDLTNVVKLKGRGVLLDVPWPDTHPLDATVVYTHGAGTVPPELKRAAVEYAARMLGSEASGTSRDVRSQAFDGGTTSYITPDWDRGRPTGWTEVDRILNSMSDAHRPLVG